MIQLEDTISPFKLPVPEKVWLTTITADNRMQEVEVSPDYVPYVKGRVIHINGPKIELRWGSYGQKGSVRAMYSIG